MPNITIYTDGGCAPNPGPGGWGALVVGPGSERRELSGSEAESTNNRMELTAAIEALRSIEAPSEIELITDSTYLKNGITSWIDGWRRRGWKTASKQPVKNKDLWIALDEQNRRHQVRWRWTRGHTGHEGNERAHELAAAAIERPGGTVDDLPLGDRDAAHLFLGIAWSARRKLGGWGAVLCFQEHQKELSGAARVATSNAVHIASAVQALEALTRAVPVHVYTASDYLRDGATNWIHGWRQRQWQTSAGKPVASRELWERLDRQARHVDLTWHVVSKDDLPPEVELARELANEALIAAR